VQLFHDFLTTPVDDLGVLWDEAVTPFIKIAQLVFDSPQDVWGQPTKDAMCEQISFTPWQVLPENKPQGVFQEVRRAVYQNDHTLRHFWNRQVNTDWTNQTLNDYIGNVNSVNLPAAVCSFTTTSLDALSSLSFTLHSDAATCDIGHSNHKRTVDSDDSSSSSSSSDSSSDAVSPIAPFPAFNGATGALVQVSLSVNYTRVGDHDDDDDDKCGLRARLTIGGQQLFRNDAEQFAVSGVISASIELQLAFGTYDLSFDLKADDCDDDQHVRISQPVLSANIVKPLVGSMLSVKQRRHH